MIFENDFHFLTIKTVVITACTLGMMSTLTIFSYPLKKVLLIFGIYLAWVGLSTAIILHIFGFYGLMRLFLFTVSAPAIFLAYRMDKDSPTQSVFNYATQIVFSIVLIIVAMLINTALRGGIVMDLLIRVVIYALVIFLEYKFLRRPFRQLADMIKTGWGILSLIPVTFCFLLVIVASVPVHYIKNPVSILYIVSVVVTLLIVYFVVFQSLMRQYRLQMLIHDKEVLGIQVAAMKKQADVVFAAEEKLQILRHDIRHFMSVITASLASGSIEQTSSALATFESIIADTATKSYCKDYVLNAILSSYLEQAEKEGIEVNASFTPPTSDKVDKTTFAVMLANALENSLNSCRQGNGKQSILLKSRVFNGQYLLELSNTCDSTVIFDKDNIPLSKKGVAHGIGTRSIIAFAKEHNASVSFDFDGTRFVLHMIISLD